MRLSVESESEFVPVDTSDKDERLLISEREELTTIQRLVASAPIDANIWLPL